MELNPYKSPEGIGCRTDYCDQQQVTLVSKRWFWREFEVRTKSGTFLVAWNGHGFGYETVLVNKQLAVRTPSFLWYVPRFDFMIGGHAAVVEVQIWPWLAVRSFRLAVDGENLYLEGSPH